MTINNIEHNLTLKNRKATITLDVEEISNIANSLCVAVKEWKHTDSLLEIHRDMFLLFELVKNGGIDSFTVEHLGKCQDQINHLNADKGGVNNVE